MTNNENIILLFFVIVIGFIFISMTYIFPSASGQILPFEQQLEQIRDPQECTRKVVQGKSAEVPFTFKVFYDTTRNNKLEFKQQGTTFPVVQRTNQVITFFTDGADQYEIHIELNYDEALPRQVYIEYLSANEIVQSQQEKFEGTKFCMTIFVNTIIPTPVPTKEEIFGESLGYIAQIPAMVVAFNANSQTSASSIAYMWLLLLGVLILCILTYINSQTGKRKFDSRMRDFEDSIVEVNKMTGNLDKLDRSLSSKLNDVIRKFNEILSIPQINESLTEEKKESSLKKFIPFRRKKEQDETEETEILQARVIEPEVPKQKTESEQILEALMPTPNEIAEEKEKEPELSGGFVISENAKEKVPPQRPSPPKENNPMKLQPKVFNLIMKEIDFEKNQLKEGAINKFSYTELNESFSWISNYRNWIEDEEIQVPENIKVKQLIAQEVIYHAIFKKMEERSKI